MTKQLAHIHKIVTGKYDPAVSPTTVTASTYVVTKSNNLQLQKNGYEYDLWKYCFTNTATVGNM